MTFKLVVTIQIQFLPYVLYFHACLHVWIIHRTYVPLFQTKYKGMRGDPGLLHNIARNKTMIILVSDKGANHFTITKITLLILWEYVTLNPATCTSKWIHVRPDLSMWTCHPFFFCPAFVYCRVRVSITARVWHLVFLLNYILAGSPNQVSWMFLSCLWVTGDIVISQRQHVGQCKRAGMADTQWISTQLSSCDWNVNIKDVLLLGSDKHHYSEAIDHSGLEKTQVVITIRKWMVDFFFFIALDSLTVMKRVWERVQHHVNIQCPSNCALADLHDSSNV